MVNTNIKWTEISNSEIVNQMGLFIKNERLNNNKTQAQLATEAGVNKWTISQIEKGQAITLLSLIQIMRALRILNLLDIFSIQEEISPIALAKKAQQKRQRARNTEYRNPTKSDW